MRRFLMNAMALSTALIAIPAAADETATLAAAMQDAAAALSEAGILPGQDVEILATHADSETVLRVTYSEEKGWALVKPLFVGATAPVTPCAARLATTVVNGDPPLPPFNNVIAKEFFKTKYCIIDTNTGEIQSDVIFFLAGDTQPSKQYVKGKCSQIVPVSAGLALGCKQE